ncbi:MAG: hypothetical protein MK228_00595 [Nitrososphaerales archaeon]|nr:hypothetical protein [Nitrososphaerales archaeon]
MSIVANRKLDSDLMFRAIGVILIILGILSVSYTSSTQSLAPQIVPIYYFISLILILSGIFGLISVIRD